MKLDVKCKQNRRLDLSLTAWQKCTFQNFEDCCLVLPNFHICSDLIYVEFLCFKINYVETFVILMILFHHWSLHLIAMATHIIKNYLIGCHSYIRKSNFKRSKQKIETITKFETKSKLSFCTRSKDSKCPRDPRELVILLG